jgi:hypothetical protein
MYSIESDDLLHNLRVARQIIPGEEVNLSCKLYFYPLVHRPYCKPRKYSPYQTSLTDLSPSMRSEERQIRMRSQWGFECSCSLCKSPDHVKRASDERLLIMEEIEAEVNDLSVNRTASVHTAELLISLHEQERLDGVIGDAYMYAAFENAYLGNQRLVQKYAALAMEHMAIWRGIHHQYYAAMMRLLYDPEKEKSWLYFDKLADAEQGSQI